MLSHLIDNYDKKAYNAWFKFLEKCKLIRDMLGFEWVF